MMAPSQVYSMKSMVEQLSFAGCGNGLIFDLAEFFGLCFWKSHPAAPCSQVRQAALVLVRKESITPDAEFLCTQFECDFNPSDVRKMCPIHFATVGRDRINRRQFHLSSTAGFTLMFRMVVPVILPLNET
jgi:hypothetical protein